MYTVYPLFHLSFHRKPLSGRDNNTCLWTLSLTLPEAGSRRFLPHTSSRAETLHFEKSTDSRRTLPERLESSFFSPILYRLPETIFRHSGSPLFPIISITKEVSEPHFETSETNHLFSHIIQASRNHFSSFRKPSLSNYFNYKVGFRTPFRNFGNQPLQYNQRFRHPIPKPGGTIL